MDNFTWVDVLSESTPAADGTVEVELGTRPKACLVLRISCLNNAALASFAQILGAIEDIRVELHGSSFIQLSGLDLAVLNAVILGRGFIQENVLDLDNSTRSLVLVIPFGMGLADPLRGLWKTEPDEAKLQIQVDIADTGYDGLILEVGALEMPDAAYSQCLRYTTLTHTPTATGASDMDLPRTHPCLGYLIFGTTAHTGTAWTTTADQIQLLEDRNPEKFLGQHWELWHGILDIWAKDFTAWNAELHTENTAASYTQNADTGAAEQDDTPYSNHIWLPMCPDGNFDDPYDPSRFSDLKFRFEAGDTNAIRVIPLELGTQR